jgi:hypothetical protein
MQNAALQEAIPNLATIAVLWDPATGPSQIQSIEAGAQQLQFKLVPLEVHSVESLDAVVAAAHQRREASLCRCVFPEATALSGRYRSVRLIALLVTRAAGARAIAYASCRRPM